MWLTRKKSEMPTLEDALPGRDEQMQLKGGHYVSGNPLQPPFPKGME